MGERGFSLTSLTALTSWRRRRLVIGCAFDPQGGRAAVGKTRLAGPSEAHRHKRVTPECWGALGSNFFRGGLSYIGLL